MGKRKGKKSFSETDEIEALKKDLHRARSKGQWKEISDLHNRIGTLYREISHFEEALEQHQEEEAVTKRYFPNDKIGLAIALRGQAEVYLEMKEQEKALALVQKYLKLSRIAENLVEEQRAHVTLGRVYLSLTIKYSDSDEASAEESKAKALDQAELEFQKARDLCNSTAMEGQKLGAGLMDMRCGVLLNLAIVSDLRGNLEGSKQFVLKAMEIARTNTFYEHLYRGTAHLSEIYAKLEDYSSARKAGEEAAKAGKALDNLALEVDGRLTEARMYFMLDDITSGVRILKKVRQQILSKEIEIESRDNVEILLKSGVRITRSEDKLHVTQKTDYQARQKLYECLGDSYVEVGNYTEALKNYQNSLENAQKANFAGKELAKLYFSIAATYKDKGDDLNAILYFQKEIELHAKNPKEAFKTQTSITASLERVADATQNEIMAAHEKAIELARLCDCPRKEFAALSNYAFYLGSIGNADQSAELKEKAEELREMYNLPDENEEPDSQDDLLDEDTDSIDLDNLTSDEESSDEEDMDAARKAPPKQKKIRVNEKGETPLHRAAIKGDIRSVRRFLRQGHPVDPKDTGGWTPLHEACNYGYLEIVEELLQHGANVNMTSSRLCNELTPILDAANNGHFGVIQMLLSYNANVLLRDARGNYPIDLLIAWRERVKLTVPEDLATFREIRNTLKDLMAKAGRPYEKSDEIRARRLGKQEAQAGQEDSPPQFDLMESRVRGEAPVPVRIIVEEYDPDDADAAVDLYSTTIKGLRRNRDDLDVDGPGPSSPVPIDNPDDGLIPESQFVDDDWLVDIGDMPMAQRTGKQNKRKRDPLDEVRISDTRNIRRRRDGKRKDVARMDIGNSDEELLDLDEDIPLSLPFRERRRNGSVIDPTGMTVVGESSNSGSDSDLDLPSQYPPEKRLNTRPLEGLLEVNDNDGDSGNIATAKKKPSHPIVLSSDDDEESGDLSVYRRLNNDVDVFPTSASSSKSTTLSRNRSISKSGVVQRQTRLPFKIVQSGPRQTEIRSNTSPTDSAPSSRSENILRLKIRVNEKTFMVPVTESHLNDTIGWLCEECSRRYFESYGVRPVLSLSTKDGAILSGNDIIRVVLCGNETELIASVTSFDLQMLPERFKSAAMKIPDFSYDNGMLRDLEVCQSSNVLSLPGYNLRSKIGQVLFQSLRYQNALRELHVPDCSLHDEGVKHLSSIWSTLPNLAVLDLSSNGITNKSIHEFSETLKGSSDGVPLDSNLISLNLSFNPLGNSAGSSLTLLLSQLPQLQNLMISNCNFTLKLLTESRLCSAFSRLKLAEVDLSYNHWGKKGLDSILQSLVPGRIKTLNCASTGQDEDDSNLGTALSTFLGRNEDCCNLRELNLSDCSLNDVDIDEISCHFRRLVRLESIILTNNDDITISSVQTIINECVSHKIPLTHLDLRSCPKLWLKNGFLMEGLLTALESKLSSERKLEFMRLTADCNAETPEGELSEREKRIARLWEEYSGTSSFSCARLAHSTSFSYNN